MKEVAAMSADRPDAKVLTIKNLSKSFQINAESIAVLDDINLDIAKNEFICIISASGCGKSTLLRIIGGLEPDYDGEIYAGDRLIAKPGVDRGIVFQEARLFLWLTIAKNVEFGLPDNMAKKTKKELVKQHLQLVGLENFDAAARQHRQGIGQQSRYSVAG